MTGKDFEVLAGYVADAVIRKAVVRDKITSWRRNFLEMKYCLPAGDAVSLAARMFAGAFSDPRFADRFVKELGSVRPD